MEWTKAKDVDGYGLIKIGGRMRRVTRIIHELFIGKIPEGLSICHLCDNPPCIDPDHLFAGTQLENQRDKTAKGRQARGKNHGRHSHPEAWSHVVRDSRGRFTATPIQQGE